MQEKDKKLIRLLGVLSTVGITLVAATMIGLYIGYLLDKAFGTTPWLTGIFLLLGLFAGFRNLYRYAKRAQQAMDDERPDEEKNHDR